MPHRQFEKLREEMYEVLIDSSLEDGYLTYGEYLHKGETADEFLLLAHVSHDGTHSLLDIADRFAIHTRLQYSAEAATTRPSRRN
jgi:aminopeptidase-like protein